MQGSAVPSPYGGKERQIQIDLDPQALQAKGLSAEDVENAVAAQNQIIPAGTTKIGQFEYNVKLNDSPATVDELNDLPIKTVNGTTIYMRDVAHVRDGFPPQRNVVRMDGRRGVLMTVLKSGSASTLDIIDGVKALLPRLKETLPPSLHLKTIADQSMFVSAAISGVVREGVIAAALTSLMILLFLGSWRSTVIIATSIPLAILSSIALLSAMGQTLNIMTLGGLALAVGILVDDATVTIENINWHLEQRQDRPGGDPRRRRTDRDAGLRLASLHLHRLRADVLAAGRVGLSVRADGRGRGFRDDRVLRAVAHAGSGDGELSACRAWHQAHDRRDAQPRCGGGIEDDTQPFRLDPAWIRDAVRTGRAASIRTSRRWRSAIGAHS